MQTSEFLKKAKPKDASKLKVSIVASRFHSDITDAMVEGAGKAAAAPLQVREDAVAPLGVKPVEERATDLTVGAGDQRDWSSHGRGRYQRAPRTSATHRQWLRAGAIGSKHRAR